MVPLDTLKKVQTEYKSEFKLEAFEAPALQAETSQYGVQPTSHAYHFFKIFN